ncbi:MAG: TonB family protein [Gemmatimonadales bacterium]
MTFPFRRHRSATDPDGGAVGIVGFVNGNSGLSATGADSTWSAGVSLAAHAVIIALLPLWRVGVGPQEALEPLEAGGGGIVYVMPILPEDAPEAETGGELVSADLRGEQEGTGAVAGTMAGGTQGPVVTDADYGSLFDVLGERMRRGRSILPTLAVPTTVATGPAEPEPGVVEEPPEPVAMDEPDIETDVTTVELADLPASDSLDLGRLTGLRPELAFMTASAWVLIRNQEEVEAYLRRTYREGRLDPAVRGTVSVTLWIDQQGAVEWAEVSQSSGRTDLDEVALALFNEVADFRAARDRGQTVSRSVTFSLNFPW